MSERANHHKARTKKAINETFPGIDCSRLKSWIEDLSITGKVFC